MEHVTKRFGDVFAMKDISLKVENGELRAIIGPTGCGKTTLLRTIAGLETPTEGRVYFDDEDVTDYSPKERNIAFVFQNYALYPHLTVFDNMAQPLISEKRPKDEIKKKVEEIAAFLNISHLLNRKPAQLSGGQQQRVAIGRAMVRSPRVLLLDEPLSNLDAQLRLVLRAEMKRLIKEIGITSIYVTHDQVEAMSMADKITVMNNGVILQTDNPISLYSDPINTFVARFVGTPEMNIIPVKISRKGGKTEASIDGRSVLFNSDFGYEGEGYLGIRPHKVSFGNGGIIGKVITIEPLGNVYIYHVLLENGTEVVVSSNDIIELNSNVQLSIDTNNAVLFDSSGMNIKKRQQIRAP